MPQHDIAALDFVPLVDPATGVAVLPQAAAATFCAITLNIVGQCRLLSVSRLARLLPCHLASIRAPCQGTRGKARLCALQWLSSGVDFIELRALVGLSVRYVSCLCNLKPYTVTKCTVGRVGSSFKKNSYISNRNKDTERRRASADFQLNLITKTLRFALTVVKKQSKRKNRRMISDSAPPHKHPCTHFAQYTQTPS